MSFYEPPTDTQIAEAFGDNMFTQESYRTFYELIIKALRLNPAGDALYKMCVSIIYMLYNREDICAWLSLIMGSNECRFFFCSLSHSDRMEFVALFKPYMATLPQESRNSPTAKLFESCISI